VRRRLLSGWTVLIVAATVGVLAAVVFYPGRRSLEVDMFVLFLGALGLALGVSLTREASPDVHGPSLADELADPLDVLPQRPVELERMEREVYLSLGTSFHLYHRLRPMLREIAENQLRVRHGLDLEQRPDDAHELLGDAAWSWLRPDCPEPRDRWGPGPPLAELTAVVDALERI
jgi:hypothetical protein